MDSIITAKIITNFCIFLEFSDETVIDDDVAVNILEQITHDVHKYDASDQKALCEAFRKIAPEFPEHLRQFVEEQPYAFSLEEDDSD